MKNIYLVRHGETVSNAGGVAIRNADIPLTELGKEQAKVVTTWLLGNVRPIDNIFISKFIRTHQTASPLLEKINIEPTVIDGLEEFNYIDFSRIKNIPANERRKLSHNYWQTATPDYIDGEDAESFNQLQTRITKVLNYFEELPNGNYIVYTHGLWLSMFLWRLLKFSTTSNPAMQQFRQFEQAIKIKNTDVFLLQLQDNLLPSITKVRTLDY